MALSAIVRAQVIPGINNNVTGCVTDQYVCDPYLRQKVEPKGVCSALNGQQCLFVANDYRTVSLISGDGAGESTSLFTLLAQRLGLKAAERVAAFPDAWVGVYRCARGADGPCVNGLWPGFPQDTTPLGTSAPEHEFAAASDPTCGTDDKGNFGCVAMFFNRGGAGIITTRFWKAYNDETKNPIRADPTVPVNVIVRGAAAANGKFADLGTIFNDGRGRWFVGWTQFHSAGSHIRWRMSTDGGRTWSVADSGSNPLNSVQRVVFATDKVTGPNALAPGAPPAGPNVYMAFRGFDPNAYYLATLAPGAANFSAPVNISALSGPATACTYDAASQGFNENANSQFQYARAKDFLSIETDTLGNLYFTHTERVGPDGLPLSAAACNPSAPAAVVVARSSDRGLTFTPRRAVDVGQRCETAPAPGTPPTDITSPNGACSATAPIVAVPRAAGVQMQPVLKAVGGHLVVTYREGRGAIGPAPGFFSGRTRRIDIRAAKLAQGSLTLLATRQVSQYEYDNATGNYAVRSVPGPGGSPIAVPGWPTAPGSDKTNAAFLPLHNVGTTPFFGDHDDLVGLDEQIADSATTGHWATAADVPSLRMVSVFGGDSRETGYPLNNGVPDAAYDIGWQQHYAAAGTGPSCVNPTARFSNVMTSMVTGTVEAYAVQTFKPLGVLQRTWPIVIRNRSDQTARYRVTLAAQPGFAASWDSANASVTVYGANTAPDGTCAPNTYPSCTPLVTVFPKSSISLAAFGSAAPGTNVRVASPIRVLVDDVATSQNPDAIVRLNPNPIQYDMTFYGPGTTTTETHGRPSLTSTTVRNYSGATRSPSGGNPTQGGPTQGGPTQGGPTQGGTTVTEIQQTVTSGDTANTTSGFEAVANFADAYLIDLQTDPNCFGPNNKCHETQVIVSRTHSVPTVAFANGQNCSAQLRADDEIISYTNLGPTPTQGGPTQGGPTQGGPTQGGPTQGGPTQGGSTFTLTPASATEAGTLASAAFAAKAVASASSAMVSPVAMDLSNDGTVVGDPPIDAAMITYRIKHYHPSNFPESAPTTVTEVARTFGVVAIPEAEDNKAGGNRPLAGNDAYQTVQGTPITINATDGVLRNDFGVTDFPLSAVLDSAPPNGTFTFAADGSFTYKPKGNFVGLDSFTYHVTEDGALQTNSAIARVWITVTAKK